MNFLKTYKIYYWDHIQNIIYVRELSNIKMLHKSQFRVCAISLLPQVKASIYHCKLQ